MVLLGRSGLVVIILNLVPSFDKKLSWNKKETLVFALQPLYIYIYVCVCVCVCV